MMCLMSATESFKLEVGSSEVTGTLMLPRGASARSPSGSVIRRATGVPGADVTPTHEGDHAA
jgi:hypothetical protein